MVALSGKSTSAGVSPVKSFLYLASKRLDVSRTGMALLAQSSGRVGELVLLTIVYEFVRRVSLVVVVRKRS